MYQPAEAPVLLNGEAVGLSDRDEAFDGVAVVGGSPWLEVFDDGCVSVAAVEGEDLTLDFYVAVMTREGAFLQEVDGWGEYGEQIEFVGIDLPRDSGWDLVNTDGLNLGRLFKARDESFGASFGIGEPRRGWTFIRGHELPGTCPPNTIGCCMSWSNEVTVPFSEIEPTGKWGSVRLPMRLSVCYYDIADGRYERAYRTFELIVHFTAPADPAEVP